MRRPTGAAMITAMDTAAKPKAGLEDTVATSSAICYLDGDRGVLAYCGYDIHDLARHATFEEVCYLLWHRRLPTRAELGDLQAQLVAARPLPEPVLRLMRMLPPGDGMDMLRTLTSALSHYDADAADNSAPANYRKAVRLTAQISSLVATMGRVNAGGGADSARSGAVPRRQFPLHAHRRAAERAGDAGVRRRAGAPRRSRAQRLDVCGAGRGRDAHRHPFGDRRRRSARSRDRCTAAPTPT